MLKRKLLTALLILLGTLLFATVCSAAVLTMDSPCTVTFPDPNTGDTLTDIDFTPSETAVYYFYSTQGDHAYGRIHDDEGNNIYFMDNAMGQNDFGIAVELQGDTHYRLEIGTDNYDCSESNPVSFVVHVRKSNGLISAEAVDPGFVLPGNDVTLTVNATAQPGSELTYAWYPDGEWWDMTPLGTPSQTGPSNTYTVHNVEMATYYYCKVTDQYGASMSLQFFIGIENQLVVYVPGGLQGGPATDTYAEDSFAEVHIDPAAFDPDQTTIDLSVVASCLDDTNLRYEWYGFEYDANWNFKTEPQQFEYDTPSVTLPLYQVDFDAGERCRYGCNIIDRYENGVWIEFWVMPQNDPGNIISEGTCGENLTWALDSNGVLTISGTGAMYDYSGENTAPWQDSINNINTVVFDSGVVDIGYNQFSFASQLTAFVVDPANPSYASKDGVLYNKDMTRLIEAPIQKTGSFTIPSSVTNISVNAFYNSQLSVVYVKEGVTSLPFTCFSGAENLSEVYLPASLTSIGFAAFDQTFALEHVYYAGSTSDWYNISIDDFNDQLNSCTIHCSDDIISPPTKLSAPEIQQIVHGSHTGTDVTCHVSFPEGARMVHVEFGQYDPDGDEFYEKVSFKFNSESDFHVLGLATPNAGTYQIRATAWTDETPAPDPYDSDIEIYEFELEGGPLPSAPEVTLSGYDEIITNEYGNDVYTINLANHSNPSVSYAISNVSSYAFAWDQVNPVTNAVMSTSGTPTSVIPGSSGTFHFEGGPGRYDLSFWRCDNGVWSWQNTIYVELKPIGGYLPEPKITYRNHTLWADNPVQIFPDESLEFTVSVPGAESITFLLSEMNNGIDDFIYSENRTGDESTFDLSSDVSFPGQYRIRFIADKEDWVNSDISIVLNLLTVEPIDSGDFGNGFAWELNNRGVLTISGTGSMPGFSANATPWAGYQDDISSVVINSGITSIGNNAFPGCGGSVTIPSSVTLIGDGAFSGCTNMGPVFYGGTVAEWSNITIGDNNNPLLYCIKHCSDGDVAGQTITGSIGNGVTYTLTPDGDLTVSGSGGWIHDAFSYNFAIIHVTLESGVTEIGQSAFEFCENMVSIHIPVTVTVIQNSFEGCSMTDIYYAGSEEQWNAILVNDYSDTFATAQIHYNSSASPSDICGDGLSWTLDSNGMLTVSGTGSMYDYSNNTPWEEHKESIVTVVISEGVTSVGDTAFENCSNLTSVSLPDSLTGIGYHAFTSSGLTSVTIPGNVATVGEAAFQNCSNLENAVLQSGVTAIDKYAFADCGNLGSIVIPGTVNTIGIGAFWSCTGLTSITIPDSVTSIGDYAFNGCNNLSTIYAVPESTAWTLLMNAGFGDRLAAIQQDDPSEDFTFEDNGDGTCTVTGYTGDDTSIVIPEELGNGLTVTAIGEEAFAMKGLTSVVIPGTVTHIGSLAFSECDLLESVTIPNSVTTIGYSAFSYCWALTDLTIPDSVVSISSYAFAYTDSLTTITIPASVTSIGDGAFAGSTGLTAIQAADTNSSYASVGGVLFNKSRTQLIAYPCGGPNTYTIPDGVTSIGDYAFNCCYSLSDVIIPDSVTSIGSGAFLADENLSNIYYSGTEEQWNAIDIGNENDSLASATIHYNHTSYIDSGTCGANGDNLTWTLDSNGLLTISGTGEMYDYDYNSTPWLNNRSSVASIHIETGVTKIGTYAFYYCTNLSSVSIPNTVTSIGSDAFSDCSSLSNLTIPSSIISIGDRAFAGCTNLTNFVVDTNNDYFSSEDGVLFNKTKTILITCLPGKSGSYIIPQSVTSIGDYAFQDCEGITSIAIPNTVSSIGNFAFSYTSLTTITIPVSVTHIGDYAYSGCNSLTDIHYTGTTQQWSSVTVGEGNDPMLQYTIHCSDGDYGPQPITGTIGDGITYVLTSDGDLTISGAGEWYIGAFSGNEMISTVTLEPGVSEIGEYAFSNCHSLSSITVPNTVTSIKSYAFDDCDNLYSITIPRSVTTFGDGVFFNIDIGRLKDIYFGGTETEWLALLAGTDNDECLTAVNIHFSSQPDEPNICGDSVTWALENGVLTISGTGAMYDYSYDNPAPWNEHIQDITSVVIGDGVTHISACAFPDADSLSSVTISDRVTSIGNNAFIGCFGLTSITIPNSVSSIGSSAFYHCTALTNLVLPDHMTFIGEGAFESCGLTSVVIPSGITVLKDCVFANCPNLTSVTIPNSVVTIDTGAFIGSGITTVNVPAGVATQTHYFYYMDDNCVHDALYRITLPASVTSISEDSFYTCPLQKVNPGFVTPASLTTIEEDAFSGISATYVWLTDGVSSIGSGAFSNCSNLAFVRIPKNCTNIAPNAFPASTTLLIPAGYNNWDASILHDLGYTNIKVALFIGGNG